MNSRRSFQRQSVGIAAPAPSLAAAAADNGSDALLSLQKLSPIAARWRRRYSLKPEYACALGAVSIQGQKPADIAFTFMDKYPIHVVPILWKNVDAVRVTQHVYKTTKGFDGFIEAVGKVAVS
jgi:hypothetical protein